MCQVCASFRPWQAGCDYEGLTRGGTDVAAGRSDKPHLGVGAIVDLLLLDYWGATEPAGWDRQVGDTITYDVDALSSPARRLAHAAFDEWAEVTGLRFVERSRGADIRFTDWDDGAYAELDRDWDGTITGARVNVDAAWTRLHSNDYDSYNFQTFLHEIGHALGLGHPGVYNGEGVEYEADAEFRNDSWQMSVMSYFDQEEAGTRADYATAITPMIADVAAVHRLYGTPKVHNRDSVYGEGSNVGGMIGRALGFDRPVAVTIVDTGGHDRIDLGSQRAGQRIELRDGYQSDVGGLKGNVLIALGSVIEDVRVGRGDDRVRGNEVANRIDLGRGDDRAHGLEGDDRINGARGADRLSGGEGDDKLFGSTGRDRLEGDEGDDVLIGGDGEDRIWGHEGEDRLVGGEDRDELRGGRDDDRLIGGGGNDLAMGGGGADELSGGRGADVLIGGGGHDRLDGGAGHDDLRGGSGRDHLVGGSGRDELDGAGGADTLFGSGGADYMSGGGGDDVLWSGGGGDDVNGGGGDDKLCGQGGDDRLQAGVGDDLVYGHAGDDMLWGGPGDDVLSGGAGRDMFTFAGRYDDWYDQCDNGGRDTVIDFTPGEDTLALSRSLGIRNARDFFGDHAEQVGRHVVVTYDAGQVILRDVDLVALSADDFAFGY